MSTSYAPGGSQYLQNPATEILDMNGHGVKFGSALDVGILPVANAIYFVNNALQGGVLKSIRCLNLTTTGNLQILDGQMLHGQGDYGTSYDIYAASGVNGGTVARIHSRSGVGVDDYRIDILRLACSNLPTSDPADGLSRIWSDGGVLTLGT